MPGHRDDTRLFRGVGLQVELDKCTGHKCVQWFRPKQKIVCVDLCKGRLYLKTCDIEDGEEPSITARCLPKPRQGVALSLEKRARDILG